MFKIQPIERTLFLLTLFENSHKDVLAYLPLVSHNTLYHCDLCSKSYPGYSFLLYLMQIAAYLIVLQRFNILQAGGHKHR